MTASDAGVFARSSLPGALLAALPCFALATALVGAWIEPLAWDEGRFVPYGVGLFVLEFVVLHSGAFMAALARGDHPRLSRPGALVGLTIFYALVAWGITAGTGSMALPGLFGSIMLGRLLAFLIDGRAACEAMLARSALGIALYVLVAFATIAVPVPRLGVTPQLLERVYPQRGNGLWERHPERPLAGGALYFSLLGLAELTVFRRARRGPRGWRA